ncbi:MAG: hypothetical protein ACE37H_04275 [Phycisphaeraceae bacterium]
MKRTLNQLGTFAIVTVVAVLVWLYAEDANIQEYTEQTVRLEFELPESGQGLITPSGPITVSVDFLGSNGQYQQFIERTRGEPLKIKDLPFDPALDLQTLDVDIQEQLERDVLRGLGVNITGISPDRVAVTFERIVDVQLDVQLVQDTGPIKLSTAQIPNEGDRRLTLRLPAGQAERLKGVTALAYVRERDVRDVPKGGSKQFAVPVELPAGLADLPPVTANAQVVVTVANDRDTVTIDRRPVLLSYPSSINERYVVEIDESARFITAFELEGPREQIALIKADINTPQVWATIRLTNEEVDKAAADGGELTKPVEVIAPAGVAPASVAERVTIRVTPRPASATP